MADDTYFDDFEEPTPRHTSIEDHRRKDRGSPKSPTPIKVQFRVNDFWTEKISNKSNKYDHVEVGRTRTGFSKISVLPDINVSSPQNENEPSRLPKAGGLSQAATLQAVKTLLVDAAEKVNQKRDIAASCRRRAIPVSSIRSGMTIADINGIASSENIQGVCQYDADYESVLTAPIVQPGSPFLDSAKNGPSVAKSTTSTQTTQNQNQERPYSQRTKATESIEMNVEVCESLLIRTGTKKCDLDSKAQEIYANFLSDIISSCKERSKASISVEENAMHRKLAEYIRSRCFAATEIPHVVQLLTAAAVEDSLTHNA